MKIFLVPAIYLFAIMFSCNSPQSLPAARPFRALIVNWQSQIMADSYNVYRRTYATKYGVALVKGLTLPQYIDVNIQRRVTYCYVATSVLYSMESVHSNEYCITTN